MRHLKDTSAVSLIAPLLSLTLFAASADAESGGQGDTLQVTLNGLAIRIDRSSGSIVGLTYPGPGTLLDTTADQAGIIDLAYPMKRFEPLRLASRYSRDARIDVTDQQVTISWPHMGASRAFDLPGDVRATVHMKAAPDGRSVILSCEVDNASDLAVRQVVFPDLFGLLPTAGADHTLFKTGGCGRALFRELRPTGVDIMYLTPPNVAKFESGGCFSPMVMRWMDLGGLNGGFSLFPKRWGWDPHISVITHLSEITGKLRLMCVHAATVPPKTRWQSGEFVLTPHKYGWAKGIEPFREWARQHMKREYPVPDHVRKGLGYRTVWMCQNCPEDPNDAVWKFSDLVSLAREAKEHGLDEMVLWSTHRGFQLPIPAPYPHLGTEQELVKAVADCKAIGVNVAPFISVLQAGRSTAAKYGLNVPETGGWTYHTEFIPIWNPPYAGAFACAQVDIANKTWQAEVLASCKHYIDIGIPSISWDQYLATNQTPNLHSLTSQIRAMAKKRDPQSTFSGEELFNIELDADHLDYTWNWGGYGDWQALTSVFPAPRRNINIDRSALEAKRGFMDSLYLNVLPTRPGSINGSDRIGNHPDLSRALKQCAKLRKQFVTYFADGTFIGNGILSKECNARVTAYVLPDRALMLIMNEAADRPVSFECDPAPWIKPSPSGYETRCYDGEGNILKTSRTPQGPYQGQISTLRHLDIAVYEFVAGPPSP